MSQETSVLPAGPSTGAQQSAATGATPAAAGAVKPGSTGRAAGAMNPLTPALSPGGGEGGEALSTASLTARIAAQLKGETVKSGAQQSAATGTGQTGTAAGQGPSPAGGPDPNESSTAPAGELAAQGTEANPLTPALSPDGVEGGEAEGDDDQPRPEEHRLPPEAVKALAEERAKRRALRQKLAERDDLLVTLQSNFSRLEAQIAGLKGNGEGGPSAQDAAASGAHQSAATGHPELAKFDKDLAGIDSEIAQMERNVAWAAANPDGGTLRDAKGNPMEVDATYVRQWQEASAARVRQLEREANRLVSARETRAAALETEARTQAMAVEKQALKLYPWLNDKKSREWAEAKKFVDAHPGFAELPDALLLLGQIVTGKAPAVNGNGAGGSPAGLPQAGSPAPLTGGKPTPQLPGATRTLPARAAGGEPLNSSVLFNRMREAKTEAERESAKEEWVKSLGKSLAV